MILLRLLALTFKYSIADKNIDPSIEKDEYYAFMVSRRGDNTKGGNN